MLPTKSAQWKISGAMIILCCRIVNVIKNKNIKKQPWGNVECFAFGGATVRFASLETVSMPPTTHSLRQVRSTGIAKRLFFMFFVSVPQYLSTERFSEDSNHFVKGIRFAMFQCV